MKFGQNLPRNQVPEWATNYIDYKSLKKLIKSAQHDSTTGEDADLAEFFYTLDRQLEDVDAFYNRKYAEFARRLRLLYDRYGQAAQFPDGLDRDEMNDLMTTLLELRSDYRKLQWYGEVNRRGFVKITKKLDKKIAYSPSQTRYLATKVDPKRFANNYQLTADMRAINDWLLSLGDVKVFDDAGSSHSAGSLHRVSSKSTLRMQPGLLDSVDLALRQNSYDTLAGLLNSATLSETSVSQQRMMLEFLQRAISCKSLQCANIILQKVDSLDEIDDMNKRNCLHRLVISVGRSRVLEAANGNQDTADLPQQSTVITAAEPPVRAPGALKAEERDVTRTLGREDPSVKLLVFILESLSPAQRPAIITQDAYGRSPLHYSAQYGLVAVSQELLRYMHQWGLFDLSKGVDSAVWQDLDGYAPLHLAVIGGHYRTTKALLLAEDSRIHSDTVKPSTRKHIEKSGVVLALATKSNFNKIVRLLVEAGVDTNYQDEQGETALHVAARFGYDQCISALLEDEKINLELAEKTYGWTPLFIACVDGYLPIVELLIAAGAELVKADISGWTPKEHAALRGHLDIAHRLAQLTPSPEAPASPKIAPAKSSATPSSTTLEERRSNHLSKENANGSARVPEPIKSFGHRYLMNDSMVLVSLGTMDNRKILEAVKLESISLADAHKSQLDTALSLVVSATGAVGEPTVIDLPIQENISTTPITFTTRDPAKVKILFDIVPTYAGSQDKRIARGVAQLATIKPHLGSKRISLQGDLSVPVLAAETLDVIGSVNFNFLIITPFKHPNMSVTEEHTYWKSMASTLVIGHRGMGKNTAGKKSLQLGENTIQSFITAANLGANYVEFDVQLTKDLVPVIYHDFLVSETGIDAPVHTLTLEQFMHVSEGTPHSSRRSSPTRVNGNNATNGSQRGRVQRSSSVGGPHDEVQNDLKERMKHTRDFKIKGFKGNSRGNFIQSPFTTLEEMFKKLPEHIGFNIEMKYPMLFESEQQEMDTYAVELNSFVDTVLTKVYDLGEKRHIIFSSFNPDICLLLSFKQPSIPVLFLSDAGTAPVGDIRASSLQEAIRFASRWNLLGVVSAADPLVLCPRLVKVVKESGLVCVSYGTLNNNEKNAMLQVREGIDALIVDSVLAIRKGLTDGTEG